MDTRTKIVDAGAAAAAARAWRADGGTVAVATGHFDVLQAAHARDLAGLKAAVPGSLLFVLLTSPADPVLAERARAEMAAALAMVDYVVIIENGPVVDALLAALEPGRVLRCEAADERRMRQLIDHVHERHTGG